MGSSKERRVQIGMVMALAVASMASQAARAVNPIDNITVLIPKSALLTGDVLGSFTYNPTNDTFYTTTYGASPDIQAFTNYASGSPTVTQLVSASQWTIWTDGGNPSNGGGSPFGDGMVIDPYPVTSGGVTIPAYSQAYIMDASHIVTDGSGNRNDLTQRFYSFDLQQADPSNLFAASSHLTSMVTRYSYASAPGVTLPAGDFPLTTAAVDNGGRQFAFSSDGKSAYGVDIDAGGTATSFPGLWKLPLTPGGSPIRLVADDAMSLAEPGVFPTAQGDRVYVGGDSTTGNPGGVDYYVVNGSTVSAPVHVLTAAQIQAVTESSATPKIDGIAVIPTADALVVNGVTLIPGGSLVIQDEGDKTTWLLDPSGRLSKITTSAERALAYGITSVNVNPGRFQFRTISYTPSGGTAYTAPQLLIGDLGSASLVSGATLFAPGDFDRNGTPNTAADLALFQAALDVRGSTATIAGNYKFDMNGDGEVDWQDVKLLQQYANFPTGDANMDGKVDGTDLATFNANWGNTSAKWTTGKFDGGTSPSDPKARIVGAADLTLISQNWGQGVSGTVGQFVANFTGSLVPGINFTTGDVGVLAAKSTATGGVKVIVTPSISIDSTSKLDLTNNALVLQSTSANKAADLATVQGLLNTGRDGGLWDGNGLTSSTAQATRTAKGFELTALAAVRNDQLAQPLTTFDGQSVNSNSILVKYTYVGDTNLDGVISVSDYAAIDTTFLLHTATPTWVNGDFNGDGVVNYLDYALIDQAYRAQSGALAEGMIAEHAAEFGAAYLSVMASPVPEPSTLVLLGAVGLLIGKRRRS